MNAIISAATTLLEHGFSVIPVHSYNHPTSPKAPLADWKRHQEEPISQKDVSTKFKNGCSIAIICGKISGHLEELDFDNPNLLKPYFDTLEGINPGLHEKLSVKFQTPSDGYAVPYRCESPVGGNDKLAIGLEEVEGPGEHPCSWRPKKYQAKQIDGKWFIEVTSIETRGEAGYFLIPPSGGYKKLGDSILDIPTLTVEERDLLLQLARSFTDKPAVQDRTGVNSNSDTRPGDEYNQTADISSLLKEHGWKTTGQTGQGVEHWTRPGKQQGTSATLKNGCFYCFSSNAYPLEERKGYSAFSLYAMLEHNGDFSAAGKSLAAKGYRGGSSQVQRDNNSGFANNANKFSTDEEWENPISIEIPFLPSVTGKMMPSTLWDMVFTISANTETPPELAAIISLAVVATACQKKCAVASSPGHTEQLSLWGVAALESGNRKSSVEKKMVAPLRKWEADKRESLEPIIKDATAQRENDMVVIKGLRGQLSKCKPSDRDRIKTEILTLENDLTEIPKPPQVWDQDITPEHLGTVMDANNECLGLFSSEGGIFDIIAGRYSKGAPNLDLFLQSHSGDPVRVSRGSRPPVNLSEPALSMGISPQPSVIKAMSNSPGFRGRGLVARFMYVLPTSLLGDRRLKNLPPVTDEVYVRYSTAIQRLLNEDYPEDGPTVIHMSTEARDMWTDFALAVEVDLRDGGRFEHIKDWAGKLPGLVTRIAGVYHCIEPDGMTLSETTMRMALAFADILIPHALATFDLMGADEGMIGARKILSWIKKNKLSEFSGRDCFEATKGTFKKVAIMNLSLDVLKEHFIIRELSPVKKPGRPKKLFEVNPKLKLKQQNHTRNIRKTTQEGFDATAETYSQYSQNSEKNPFCEYCEPFSESEENKVPVEINDPEPTVKDLGGGRVEVEV